MPVENAQPDRYQGWDEPEDNGFDGPLNATVQTSPQGKGDASTMVSKVQF